MFSRSSNRFTPRPFPDFHCVGFVKSAHGIRGDLYIKLYSGKADWLDSLKDIYLLEPKAETLSQWPVEIARPHKEGLILKVKGCNDRNHSETLRKSGAYIAQKLLVAKLGEGLFLNQVLGFELFDRAEQRLGRIVGFATNGAQDLLRVETESLGEALVPFVEAFIMDIDFAKRVVKMDLPEGLFNSED